MTLDEWLELADVLDSLVWLGEPDPSTPLHGMSAHTLRELLAARWPDRLSDRIELVEQHATNGLVAYVARLPVGYLPPVRARQDPRLILDHYAIYAAADDLPTALLMRSKYLIGGNP